VPFIINMMRHKDCSLTLARFKKQKKLLYQRHGVFVCPSPRAPFHWFNRYAYLKLDFRRHVNYFINSHSTWMVCKLLWML